MTRPVPCLWVVAAIGLVSCTTNPNGGNTLLDAMGKGAVAGLVEGLTGQEQTNPYVGGNEAVQPQQNAATNPDPRVLAGRYGKRHADLIAQGHIDVGMSEEEVQFAWGDPSGRNSKSKWQEVWNYGEDKVVFTKGKVSAVTH